MRKGGRRIVGRQRKRTVVRGEVDQRRMKDGGEVRKDEQQA